MTFEVDGYPGTVNHVQYSQMAAFYSLHASPDLVVTPVVGEDRTVRLTYTQAYAPGLLITQTAPDDIQLDSNPSSFSRRDRIILRHDWTANQGQGETTLAFKKGTPASNPQLPPVTTDAGVLYEQHMATVTVGPGQGETQSGDISMLGLAGTMPTVLVTDQSALPFARFRALVLDSTTGLARFADGSSYQPLRVQQSDTNVAVLRKFGANGQGNAFFDTERFYNDNNTATSQRAPAGTSWQTGGSLHTAQWRHPLPGVYQVMASLNVGAVDPGNQNGVIEFRLRAGMTANTATSGSIRSRAPFRWNTGDLGFYEVVHLLDTYEVGSTSDIYGLTLRVQSDSNNIRRGDNGSHFSVTRIMDL